VIQPVEKCWAVVPAAGSGSRMAAAIPKQYMMLAGEPVLQRTLQAMLGWGFLESIVVALSATDQQWPELPCAGDPRISTVQGGAERVDSVLAGLEALQPLAHERDWVLVHDAARPCVSAHLAGALREALADDEVGGLLALPVAETVKRASADQRVQDTVNRSDLWLAQTPQMFRYKLLLDAMRNALRAGVTITDESSALEYAGYQPLLVKGESRNIKITQPGDLALAERYMSGDAAQCE